MTAAIFSILAGYLQSTPHEISQADAERLGKEFVKDCNVAGNPQLTKCNRILHFNRPETDGWGLDFKTSTGITYSLRLDLDGKVNWLEKYGGEDRKREKATADWFRKAVIMSRKIVTSQGNKLTLINPKFDNLSTYGLLTLECEVNGFGFTGEVGYAFEYDSNQLSVHRYRRNIRVPTVNADRPKISAKDALAEANRIYPTSPDFDKKVGTYKYDFQAPVCEYLINSENPDEATLVWAIGGIFQLSTKMSVYGGGMCIYINAVTGKEIKI